MGAFTNMTFKDLNQQVIEIAQKFFLSRQKHSFSDEELLDQGSYSLKVQNAYNKLSDSEKNLINNEFFYQSYTWWWKGLYSKASFYRYKKEAMRSFLEAFYNE